MTTYVVKQTPGPHMRPWSEQKPRLKQLDIELTERCNNDCIHCCINRPAKDASALSPEMTTQQVKDVLRQAADLGCLQVRFTGGEPLLRPDWQELYLHTRRLGMKVLLFTNARLITPNLADLFASIRPLEPIEITVYGMHKQSYEAVTRTPGSFEQFRRGAKLLLQRGVPFVVKSVYLPENKHEIDEFEAWAETIPWMARPPRYTTFLDLRSRRDDPGKNERIKALRPSPEEVLKLLTRNAEKYRREMTDFACKFMRPPGRILFHCGAGYSMCIDAYGRAQPCMGIRAPEFTVGLISNPLPAGSPSCINDPVGETRTGGDAAIRRCLTQSPGNPVTKYYPREQAGPVVSSARGSESSAALNLAAGNDDVGKLADALVEFSLMRDRQATHPHYLRRCARCFLMGLCEQCPAKSWIEHGTLDTPVEYCCRVAHVHARCLGWLGENEFGWEVMDWRRRIKTNGPQGKSERISISCRDVFGSE